MTRTIYDFTLNSSSGEVIDLNSYRGNPIVIVNTASHCKFTPQYEDLEDLWMHFRNWGLSVLAIPSGDFGNQEYQSNEEIRNFCAKYYHINFLLAEKSAIKGKNAIPLFQWLGQEGGFFSRPKWNFYKYIINRQGKLFKWFSSVTRPSSTRFINAIERVAYDM